MVGEGALGLAAEGVQPLGRALVDNHPEAVAGAEGEVNHMPGAAPGPVPVLADCGHIGVVIQHHRHTDSPDDDVTQRHVIPGRQI